jgi:hypothetical protein
VGNADSNQRRLSPLRPTFHVARGPPALDTRRIPDIEYYPFHPWLELVYSRFWQGPGRGQVGRRATR